MLTTAFVFVLSSNAFTIQLEYPNGISYSYFTFLKNAIDLLIYF